MNILVSVIVPTFNRNESFIDAIRCLLNQKHKKIEIIIVDQSTHFFREKSDFLKRYRSKFKLINTKIPNAALARNLAIKTSKGSVIIFIDDDVLFDSDFVSNHVKNYYDNSICGVAGRVVDPNSNNSLKSNKVGTITWYGKFQDGFDSNLRQDVNNIMTCNASWRRKCLLKIGLFDSNLSGPIREDTDLSLRGVRAGCRIVYDPTALVQHVRGNFGGYRKNEGRLNWYIGFFKSETYFFLKHWPKHMVLFIVLSRYKWFFKCWYNSISQRDIRFIVAPFEGIYNGLLAYIKK